MSVLLETVDLKKTYKVGKIEVEALRGVSIRVNTGELLPSWDLPDAGSPH